MKRIASLSFLVLSLMGTSAFASSAPVFKAGPFDYVQDGKIAQQVTVHIGKAGTQSSGKMRFALTIRNAHYQVDTTADEPSEEEIIAGIEAGQDYYGFLAELSAIEGDTRHSMDLYCRFAYMHGGDMVQSGPLLTGASTGSCITEAGQNRQTITFTTSNGGDFLSGLHPFKIALTFLDFSSLGKQTEGTQVRGFSGRGFESGKQKLQDEKAEPISFTFPSHQAHTLIFIAKPCDGLSDPNALGQTAQEKGYSCEFPH